MSESKILLKVNNVSNEYRGNGLDIFGKVQSQLVLNHITFDIKEQEFFGVVGESGCGKSTLGKAILGLINFDGEIAIDSESRNVKNKKALAQKVQGVFQDPLSALNPRKTIGFTLEEPLKIHKIGNKKERSKKVNEMLELVGLDSSYRNRFPKELSGGQRQRICIGAALMLKPKLIIADEAVSALDVSVGSQILNLLKDIHKKLSLSLLFISHNLNVVYYLCDRIAVMYRGNIVELGEAKAIYDNPLHPYTKLLLSAIPDINKEDWGKDKETTVFNHREETLNKKGCCFYHRCSNRSKRCIESEPPLINIAGERAEPHFVGCYLREEVTN